MPDPLKKVSPGDRIRSRTLPAEAWNAFVDAAQSDRAARLRTGGGPLSFPGLLARITRVRPRNASRPPMYSWVAVVPLTDEDGHLYYVDAPGSGAGRYDGAGALSAIPEDLNPDVPADGSAIVVLKPGGGPYMTFFWPGEQPKWARLTDSDGANYSGVESYESSPGSFTSVPGGLTWDKDVNPLVEANGVEGLANNTFVQVRRGYGSGYPWVQVERYQAGSDSAPEVQKLYVWGGAGGTHALTFDDGETEETTDPLDFDATETEIEDALNALANAPAGGFTVTDVTAGGVPQYLVDFGDNGARRLLTADYSELLGNQHWTFREQAPYSFAVEEYDGNPAFSDVRYLYVEPNGCLGYHNLVDSPLRPMLLGASATSGGLISLADQHLGTGVKAVDALQIDGNGVAGMIYQPQITTQTWGGGTTNIVVIKQSNGYGAEVAITHSLHFFNDASLTGDSWNVHNGGGVLIIQSSVTGDVALECENSVGGTRVTVENLTVNGSLSATIDGGTWT